MGVHEDTVHLIAGQKRLKDKYKDPDMLPKVNKADIAGMMESIEECLRSHCSIMRAYLAYVIWKIITVPIYGNDPKYATHDDEMIARMLQLPSDKNKLHNEQSAQSVIEHMADYKIDNRCVYDLLHQICKDTDMYPYVKKHQSKRDGRGVYFAILFR